MMIQLPKPSPDGASLSSQVRMGPLVKPSPGWGFFVKPSPDGASLSSQVRMGILCQAKSGWGFFVKLIQDGASLSEGCDHHP